MACIELSIIVPVYNIEEKLLRQCMESLVGQTVQNVEFIIIDDGSSSRCGEIIDEYSNIDSRFVVVHKENEGVSSARNDGLKRAKGVYISFVDGDDFIEKDMCEKVCWAMNYMKCDVLMFLHYAWYNTPLIVPNTGEIKVLNASMVKKIRTDIVSQQNSIKGFNVGSLWGKVYRRSVIEKNGISFSVGISKSQDRIFVFDYMLKADTVAVYRYFGYHYVINEKSVCHSFNKNIAKDLIKTGDCFKKHIFKHDICRQEMLKAIDIMYMNFYFECLLLNICNSNNKKKLKFRILEMAKLSVKQPFKHAIFYGDSNKLGIRRRVIIFLIRKKKYVVAYFATKIMFFNWRIY